MISAPVVVWPSLGKTRPGLRRRMGFRGSVAAVNGRPVAAVNLPEDEELARAVSGWGIAPALAQFEMELALGR